MISDVFFAVSKLVLGITMTQGLHAYIISPQLILTANREVFGDLKYERWDTYLKDHNLRHKMMTSISKVQSVLPSVKSTYIHICNNSCIYNNNCSEGKVSLYLKKLKKNNSLKDNNRVRSDGEKVFSFQSL